MADFMISYKKTMGNEGFYANDPVDVGGETWKGVSRHYHPTWRGWKIVDAKKSEPNFPNNLKALPELEQAVQDFYKNNFWDTWLGDRIPIQELANEMFDTGVNMGDQRAVMFLQEALNVFNRDGDYFPDLVVDGKMGKNTLNGLDIFLKYDKPYLLVLVINVLQGMHYINYMKKSPIQEKYARGWFERVTLNKF